jgi:hypothetical protein
VIIIRPFAGGIGSSSNFQLAMSDLTCPDAAGTPASKINHLADSLATVATVIGDRSGRRFDKV